MKVCKAALCLALTILILLFPATRVSASADGGAYAYADLGATVYFYAKKEDTRPLFAVPQTYCVEILGSEDGWYYVKYAEDDGVYQALYGYCRADGLVRINQPLENKYLHKTVKVVYKTDSVPDILPSLGSIEMTAAYYGEFTVADTDYSYVLCGGKFGYITGAIDNYPLNPLPSSDAFAPVAESKSNAKLITAVVLTTVAAATVAVLYFTGRKPALDRDKKNG